MNYFSAAQPRSIMPFQIALAIATDNHIAFKWLNPVIQSFVML